MSKIIMSRENQIEEMAKILHPDSCFDDSITVCRKMTECSICRANKLYNAGYRKYSENTVAFPCKVGDTVYFAVEDYHDCAIIDGIHITEQGILFTWVQYEVGVEVTECWDEGDFDIDDIGKTVFLTREEAIKALKGGAE